MQHIKPLHISFSLYSIFCCILLVGCTPVSKQNHLDVSPEDNIKNHSLQTASGSNEKTVITLCKKTSRYLQPEQKGGEELCIIAGHGVFIDDRGYVLTAKHVIEDYEREYQAIYTHEICPVRNIWVHEHLDLALLRVTCKEPISFAQIYSGDFLGIPTSSSVTTYDKRNSPLMLSGFILEIDQKNIISSLKTPVSMSGGPVFTDNTLIGITIAYEHETQESTAVSLLSGNIQTRISSILDASQ